MHTLQMHKCLNIFLLQLCAVILKIHTTLHTGLLKAWQCDIVDFKQYKTSFFGTFGTIGGKNDHLVIVKTETV